VLTGKWRGIDLGVVVNSSMGRKQREWGNPTSKVFFFFKKKEPTSKVEYVAHGSPKATKVEYSGSAAKAFSKGDISVRRDV